MPKVYLTIEGHRVELEDESTSLKDLTAKALSTMRSLAKISPLPKRSRE